MQIKIYLLLYGPTRRWCVGKGRRKEAKMIGFTPYPVLCRHIRAKFCHESVMPVLMLLDSKNAD